MKFRDERRPRFGVMRAREFLMKDAYSFHIDQASLQAGYDAMHKAYTAIFTRLGLKFRSVVADTGAIGGSDSEEFHVLADSGEDAIAFSDGDATRPISRWPWRCRQRRHAALPAPPWRRSPLRARRPSTKSPRCSNYPRRGWSRPCWSTAPKAAWWRCWFAATTSSTRSRHRSCQEFSSPLRMASNDTIAKATGYGGRVPRTRGFQREDLRRPLGAGAGGLRLRRQQEGCASHRRELGPRPARCRSRRHPQCRAPAIPRPTGKGKLSIARGIEVGHIFQLGRKYSDAMGATVLDESGKAATLYMGCYGIGVTRIVAAAIEQNHDARGIIWPDAIAPFQVVVVPLNASEVATCQGNRRTPLCRARRRGSRRAARRSR